jgi:hypothetical protein
VLTELTIREQQSILFIKTSEALKTTAREVPNSFVERPANFVNRYKKK